MANLDDFLKYVRPSVPGCPESVMLDAIRNACRRFCNDTWLIRETLPAGDITISVDDYTINACINNVAVGVISLLYNKRELDKKTEEELDIIDSGWRTADPGVPLYFMSPTPGRIKFNRAPNESISGGLIITIAIKPDNTTTVVNDLLYNDWYETIKYGALQELFEIPEKKWSNMTQSLWYGKRFNFGIQSGKARARMGNMTKSTSVKARQWV